MAVTLDALTANSTLTTGTITWLHVPVGAPKGVLVGVSYGLTNDDEVTAVTYAGLSLTEVAGSPVGNGSYTESMAHSLFFLGSGLPAGTATVVVTVSGTSAKGAVALTLLGDADLVVHNSVGITSGGATNGQGSITVSSTAWLVTTGIDSAGLIGQSFPLASYDSTYERDLGGQVSCVYVYTGGTVAPGTYSTGINVTQGTCSVNVAIAESASTPTTITCGPAVITSVGGVGSLLSPTNVPASAATVVVSGQQATVLTPVKVECSAATIAVTANYAVIDPQSPVVGRPIDTVSNDTWASSTGGRLYDAIDEETASDADYIFADPNGTAVLNLNNIADPGTDHGHAIYIQMWHPEGDGWASVNLYQGETLVYAMPTIIGTLAATHDTYKISIPEADAATITDYSNLRLTLATVVGGMYVGWAELRIEPTVSVECSAGTIVLTGTTATVREAGVGDSVAATAGTIVVSGTTATITDSVPTNIEATAGLIVLAGMQATISDATPAVPDTVECTPGVIVCTGGTGGVTEGAVLKGRTPRRRYTTFVEPTGDEVTGPPQTNDGAAFGSLAPMLPAPPITPPLARARPKLKLLKRKTEPAPLPFADEPLPPPLPKKPHLVVIEGRGHVVEAVPPLVVDRVAQALEQLAGAIRNDPRIARQVTEALVPLLEMPQEVDEEEEIIRMLLLQQGAA